MNENINNIQEEKTVKCLVELNRIFFPKHTSSIKSGEFAIFVADVIKKIENCEDIRETIKLKGNVCSLEYFEEYNVTCKLAERNDKFGDTYEILFINRKVDLTDKYKQKNFLMTILNEKIVDNLFNTYDNVIDLLENRDTKALCKIKGIGTTKALKICDIYEESKDYGEVYTELGQLGLSTNLIKKLVEYYKSPDTVIDKVKTNPFSLVNVDGIGFKKADEIAKKVGIQGSNPNRIKGCIFYILKEEGEKGKSYLHYSELMKILYDNLGYVEQELINEVAKDLITNKEIYLSNNGEYIGLRHYHDLEVGIKDELIRLRDSEPNDKFDFSNWRECVKITEEEQGFDFSQEQLEAIELFTKVNIMALTGLAGGGKSSTAKGMADLVKDFSISACALSGKASVRITEATGLEASTIHTLLGWSASGFLFNKNFQLETDVVIIDEATMINGELFYSLLQAIPSGAKVVIMGDVQQLTPIGNCQVFADILDSNSIPTYKLTKPHRQALESGIVPTSIKVANQQQIFDSTFEGSTILGNLKDMELMIYKENDLPSDLVVKQFMKRYNITNDLLETQVAVPTKTRGDLCTYNINLKIQQLINPIMDKREHIINKLDKERQYIIQIGDKVINTKNNRNAIDEEGNKIAVFNGNIGIVKEINNGMIKVDFDGIGLVTLNKNGSKSLELAYACTCHKLQGSGFKEIICALDNSAYMMLNAELLYTLLTRAKKYCTLIGKNSAIRLAISKRETKNKQTYLKELLQSEETNSNN